MKSFTKVTSLESLYLGTFLKISEIQEQTLQETWTVPEPLWILDNVQFVSIIQFMYYSVLAKNNILFT